MSDINWLQKRKVYRDPDTDEFYVWVGIGYMLMDDYIEGGPTLPKTMIPELVEVGTFTNAEIDNGRYLQEEK